MNKYDAYSLTDNLNNAINKMTDKEKEFTVSMLIHYVNEYERVVNENNPESIAYTFHCLIDNAILESKDDEYYSKITCKKGCSNCCYINVDITKEEAILLIGYCKEENININWKTLQEQADSKNKDNRCVFLSDDNTCKVYEHRPGNCRKQFSMEDPVKCDLKAKKQKILKFANIKAEIIHSAFMTASPSGTMADILIEYKEGLG